jgi:hypothetical protein
LRLALQIGDKGPKASIWARSNRAWGPSEASDSAKVETQIQCFGGM